MRTRLGGPVYRSGTSGYAAGMTHKLALAASIVCIVAALQWGAAASSDEDFRRGLSAFNTGDYPTALRLWRPLAERGEPRAQAGLGFMYHRGHGVAADDREAAQWLER